MLRHIIWSPPKRLSLFSQSPKYVHSEETNQPSAKLLNKTKIISEKPQEKSPKVIVNHSFLSPVDLQSMDLTPNSTERFSTLLRHSNFIDLGNFSGREVPGTIVEVVGEDLYIDYGGKFYCVCQLPEIKLKEKFTRGAKVIVRINDLEITSRFLSTYKAVTILESDCELVGLAK